jgi:hypothetical protein
MGPSSLFLCGEVTAPGEKFCAYFNAFTVSSVEMTAFAKKPKLMTAAL